MNFGTLDQAVDIPELYDTGQYIEFIRSKE